MRPFFEPLAEIERLSRGRPGRVPKGKPRVTDGTLAGIRRETPKRIIQQVPTGRVVIKKAPDLEEDVSAILTDEILPHANSGGTPFSKSKRGIKDTLSNGAAAAYCFYNSRGDWFGADFKRVYIKDIYFEKGKLSEFDSNYMFMVQWYTKSDIQAIINREKELKKSDEDYKGRWFADVLQELLDAGDEQKDNENKSEEEKKKGMDETGTYFKIIFCFQVGVGAMFYCYSPKIEKTVAEWPNPDPRGIMPVHLMVPEEDDASPIGDPILSISAGKQNLLDFDMQMYQYSQGLQYSPPVKKWGDVPTSAVKLVPDAVIDMGANKNTGTDIEVVDISNRAQSNFANNYGLIKSQILNELGATGDTSISSTVGNPGFSKTDAGVDALQARLGISDNDLRKSYEDWFGRICETLLNLHFAESKGKRELELKSETLKRMGRESDETPIFDYDQDLGKIQFTVDASTSEAQDSKKENEDLIALLEIKQKYGTNPDAKFMMMFNQIVNNSGVDDPEKICYTEEEIAEAQQNDELARQATRAQLTQSLNPQQPPTTPPENTTLPPEVGSNQFELPEVATTEDTSAQSEPLTDDEVQTIQILKERGYSEDQIADALVMMRNDMSDEEIMQVLEGVPA